MKLLKSLFGVVAAGVLMLTACKNSARRQVVDLDSVKELSILSKGREFLVFSQYSSSGSTGFNRFRFKDKSGVEGYLLISFDNSDRLVDLTWATQDTVSKKPIVQCVEVTPSGKLRFVPDE